jgi:hypothetical protein
MADDIPMIDVPEVDSEAYDPDRPISGLIHAQLVHLSVAEQQLPRAKRTGINIAMLHTEGEAAAYIQKVTAMLHPQGADKIKNKTEMKTVGKTSGGVKKATAKAGKSGG